MKKLLVGFVLATVFFFFGRNQPAIIETISHSQIYQQPQLATHQSTTQQPSQETAQSAHLNEPAISPSSKLFTLTDRIKSELDTTLFETLYSEEFKSQWLTTLPVINERLFSQMPNAITETEDYEREFTARMGILKALAQTKNSDNNDELKEFLLNYIESIAASPKNPWLLQREAASTLTLKNDLSEQELFRVTKSLDPRARNTAMRSDKELLERTIAGEE